MPDYDVSFYANAAPPQIDPFRAMAQAQSFQIQRQQAEGLREQRAAIAEDRQAAAEKRRIEIEGLQREQHESDALNTLFGTGEPVPPGEIYKIVGPDRGAKILKGILDLQTAQFDSEEKAHKSVSTRLAAIRALPESMRGQAWDTALTNYKERGIDVSTIGPYSPEALDAAEQSLLTPDKRYDAAHPKPIEVTAGASLMDQGGKVLGTAPVPPKPREPSAALREYEDSVAQGFKGSFEQYKNQDANRHRSIVSVNANGGTANDPKDIAAAIIRGEQPPDMTGLYRNAGPVRAELARQGYNLTTAQTDWKAAQKHFATLNGAQQTRIRQAADTAYHALDIIDSLAEQWNGGQFPLLNAATLKAAKGGAMGKDAQALATQLEAQITDLTSELGNVYMGGNSPTDHALALASKNLSANWSKDTLKTMTKLARTNLQIRLNAIKNVSAIGASPDNPYAPSAAEPAALVYDPKTGKFTKPGGGQ